MYKWFLPLSRVPLVASGFTDRVMCYVYSLQFRINDNWSLSTLKLEGKTQVNNKL